MIFKRKKGRPTQAESLKQARARGVPVETVLDVGVQRKTSSLIEVYSDVPHVLFEPVDIFFADIRRNYAPIAHEIIEVAVSDVDGSGLLQVGRIEGKAVTHAWLSSKGTPVRTARLDTIVPTLKRPAPYLLKIDVEGADVPAKIIDGAAGIMDQVSCIVCEMVAANFLDLAARISAHGFVLWDIVESTYYDDVFYQCDAVFLRKNLIAENPALKPFDFRKFDPGKWKVVS